MATPARPRIVTLTTDFGLEDWFVGTLKAVLLGRCPNLHIVDLTHATPPGDIPAGAFALRMACGYFPPGSIHVAVVDPGVGSSRPALAARTPDATFVGPDNGLLSWALAGAARVEVRRLENPDFWLTPVSATFHGRDVFAPVAAHLAAGGAFARIGPVVTDWVRLPWPEPRRLSTGWEGEVVYVDRFGNAITNLPASLAAAEPRTGLRVLAGERSLPVGTCYQSVAPGEAVAVAGSTGLIELAVRDGSASGTLGVRRGDQVALTARGVTEASKTDPSDAAARRRVRPRTAPNRRP